MKELNKLLQNRFDEMCATGHLFKSKVSGDQLWDTYMKGFGEDPVFRDPSSSVHNCNLCKHFIRCYGNIVSLNDKMEIMSMFDVVGAPEEYKASIQAMSDLLKAGGIGGIFVETWNELLKTNYEKKTRNASSYKLNMERNIKVYSKSEACLYPSAGIKEGDTKTFHHLCVLLPASYVDYSGASRESLMSAPKQLMQVFKRGMEEISLDTLELIRDLESQGSLLNGASYKHIILAAIEAKKEYEKVEVGKREAYLWLKSIELGGSVAGFRNTAIGTLMVDLSEGRELNAAVESYNKMVDPINYKKCKAPITKKQIADAEKFVSENGYADSFDIRCATIDDIMVSDILHSNVGDGKEETKLSLFNNVRASVNHTRHKKSEFNGIEEVGIEKFMTEILPTVSSVELYLANRYKTNFVTLLTSTHKDSKSIFKWNGNYSWTYAGGLAGKSQIKQAVKAAGGNVSAPFRCSLMWNETGKASDCDLDLHCKEGNGDEIYFGNHNISKGDSKSCCGGTLDIDVIRPRQNTAVENIFYNVVGDGTYRFFVHNYNNGRNDGFKAEIFIDGQTYLYEKRREHQGTVDLATVTIKNGIATIKQGNLFIGGGEDTPDNIWGLDTCEFHKVNLICLSPNYWNKQGVGNKHYFFMLEGAKSPDKIRSIHNEFLNDDLSTHRKVMEVLGSTLMAESTDGQLSGVGFNATVRDEVILRLGGSHKRVIKVKI